MNLYIAFILGILVGWLIEWVIDLLYWRRRNQQPASESESMLACRRRVADLENEVASYKSQLAFLQEEAERQEAVTAERSARGPALDAAEAQPLPVDDPFETIKGMTSELIRRLREAGVRTFAALGALKPQKLSEIAGDEVREPAAAADIIRQARIAGGMMKKPDDLEVIVGIGPVIARTLNNAGVFTFADLAALGVDELREIVGDRIQRLANEEDIIVQARQLAERQN